MYVCMHMYIWIYVCLRTYCVVPYVFKECICLFIYAWTIVNKEELNLFLYKGMSILTLLTSRKKFKISFKLDMFWKNGTDYEYVRPGSTDDRTQAKTKGNPWTKSECSMEKFSRFQQSLEDLSFGSKRTAANGAESMKSDTVKSIYKFNGRET